MARYILDTNVVLRLANPDDNLNRLVTDAIVTLLTAESECYLIPQVLIEFWVVVTRPTQVNGLGWSPLQAATAMSQLLERFPFLEDQPEIFAIWRQLVLSHSVMGKRAHDTRIAAAMVTHSITHLLTFNIQDFIQIPGITVTSPQQINAGI